MCTEFYAYMIIHVYIYMYVCMFVSMYLCIYVSMYLSIYLSTYIYTCMYMLLTGLLTADGNALTLIATARAQSPEEPPQCTWQSNSAYSEVRTRKQRAPQCTLNGRILAVRIRELRCTSFSASLPCPRLYHINGNAIYNVQHPWLEYLLAKFLGEVL